MNDPVGEILNSIGDCDAETLVRQFERASADYPELINALKVIGFTVCAEVASEGRNSRGSMLTDMGATVSHLVLHAALQVVPNVEMARALATKSNGAWATHRIKSSLREGVRVDVQPPAIDVAKLAAPTAKEKLRLASNE